MEHIHNFVPSHSDLRQDQTKLVFCIKEVSMNLLASVVYHLMIGVSTEQIAQQLAVLSRLEQTALSDLLPLLQRTPQDLAIVLAQLGPNNDWDRVLPL